LRKAQRDCRGVLLYSFFDFVTRWGWVVTATAWLLYPWERDPVAIVQVAGWAMGWPGRVQIISLPLEFDPNRELFYARHDCCT